MKDKDSNENVVLGYQSSDTLMLDCDLNRLELITKFAREYTQYHNLGSVLVMKTSDNKQLDFDFKPLGNFSIIFGKILSWSEIRWHVKEAYRLGIVDKSFYRIRKFGSITIRVNSKNNETPYPKVVYYFPNGDNRGIMGFLRFYGMCKKLGKKVNIND